MTIAVLAIATGLFVAFLLLYFVFPERLVGGLRRLIRRACRLRLRSIDVAGETWPFLEGGPAAGEVLLLLHGFGGDKDNWPLYAFKLTSRYRVIIPDLPGFGESRRDAAADYRIAAQTARLREFIRALGIERLHVGGNSMGGFLALKFALTYPETVRTVALLNNAGVAGTRKSELELAAERGESPLTVSNMREFDELLAFIVHRPILVPGPVKRVLGNDAIAHREFLDSIFWSLSEEIQSRPLNDELHRLSAPTLILWGRHDRVIDVSCAEVMAQTIPENRCIVFEDTGHVPMLECPAEASRIHLEFLGEHSAA